jgi:hypothetical protein
MLPIGTKRTHIPRRLMHEAVPNHFVFALEAFSAFGARAAADGAVVWAGLGVYVCVGTMKDVRDGVVGLNCVGLGRVEGGEGVTLANTAFGTAAHCTRDTRTEKRPRHVRP